MEIIDTYRWKYSPNFWFQIGHPDIVALLLENHADVNARSEDGTPCDMNPVKSKMLKGSSISSDYIIYIIDFFLLKFSNYFRSWSYSHSVEVLSSSSVDVFLFFLKFIGSNLGFEKNVAFWYVVKINEPFSK